MQSHFPSARRLHRRALLLCATLFCAAALPQRASAQSGGTCGTNGTEINCPGDDVSPPSMSIDPAQGSFTTASLAVTVNWTDNRRLQYNGFSVTQNGVDVSSQFNYTQGSTWAEATSTGTLMLVPGANTVTFVILDQTGNQGSQTVIYTYAPPPPVLPAAAPLPRATSGATPTTRDIVEAVYRLALGRDGDESGIAGWMTWYANGGGTVKQMLRSFVTGGEYQANFVTAKTPEQVVAGVYRHVYAREAEPNEIAGWAPVAASQGWVAVVDGLLNDWSYGEWFGDHAVPGAPVTAWDATRAPIMLEPGSATANVDRSLCLTIAAGPGAAYECGDLRVVHGLPAIRSLNKGRSPTLLYNSQLATPTPTVAARVVLPVNLGTPTQVTATLKVGPRWDQLAQAGPTRTWPGSQWTPGAARRIVLAYDAQGETTGLREYALEVVATYPGGSTQRWVMRGSLAVVNRLNSPFGAGWWLAGLEQIQCIECAARSRILWVGGDGSTRVYVPASVANTWVAPQADGVPDTLRSSTYNGSPLYTRTEPGGVRVFYNIQGQHTATMNRLGHLTQFVYAGTRLSEVRVPRAQASDSVASYRFEYNGPDTTLTRVTAPDLNNVAGRPTTFEHIFGDDRVTAITDPDGSVIRFDVNHTIPARGRYTMRRDRRGTDTYYSFDDGGKMTSVSTDMPGSEPDITTYMAAQETRGLSGAPILPMDAHTIVDGARTDVADVTRFWLDRFGAPWRIVDALNNETVITKSDARFPALATRTDGPVKTGPNGVTSRRTTSASYTARGNPEAQTDWSTSEMRLVINPQSGLTTNQTVYATTRYAYEDTAWPDFATRSTSPEGVVSRSGYQANGNLAWQQPGDDQTRRVNFTYNALGLVESVTTPAVNGVAVTEHYEYDPITSNLTATVSGAGTRTTLYNDSLGRAWRTESPIDATHVRVQEQTYYANSDRVEYTRGIAPALNGAPAQTVNTRTEYDAEGSPLSVARWSTPEGNALQPIGQVITQFRYDAAGRKVAEIAPDGQIDSTYYDLAGNARRMRTRRTNPATGERLVIRMEYDVLGRITKRVVPEVRYPQEMKAFRRLGTSNTDRAYPYVSNDASQGITIVADSSLFAYDELGNMTRADNGVALVRRQYGVNGALLTDSLWTSTYTATGVGGSFGLHAYGLSYAYDLEGRRTSMEHPSQLAPSASQRTVGYTYDPLTGALATVSDVLGNTFSYGYDADGALGSLILPGGVTERYQYDLDGRRSKHEVFTTSSAAIRYTNPIRSETFQYDLRGKLLESRNTAGARDTLSARYSGQGHMVWSRSASHGFDGFFRDRPLLSIRRSILSYDALGNLTNTNGLDSLSSSQNPNYQYNGNNGNYGSYHQAGTGRLVYQIMASSDVDSTFYDAAGNVVYSRLGSNSFPQRDRVSYYAADGSLRVSEVRQAVNGAAQTYRPYELTFEEYAYDALGRRVRVRTRRTCENPTGQVDCNLSTIRRTVWDDGAELYEIQMPGGWNETAAIMENDTLVHPQQTAVGSFDPNPFFGRVAYAYGSGTDQPLSITRINYSDKSYLDGSLQLLPSNTFRTVAPFAIIPLWNARGDADAGVFADDGGARKCGTLNGQTRCIYIDWPEGWFAYGRSSFRPGFWHGTLTTGKRDGTGTYYRRNRYYDPNTTRFTQEDPIGLAGGLNAYGFASGDPVSYGDPYGLNPCLLVPRLCLAAGGAVVGAAVGAGGRMLYNYSTNRPLSQGVGTAAVAGAVVGVGIGLGVSPVTGAVILTRAERVVKTAAAAMGIGTAATKKLIGEGDGFLAVMNAEGRLIAQASMGTGHQAMLDQQLGGVLPAGARAITVFKDAGEIAVRNSSALHQNMGPAPGWVQDAINSQFR